MKEEIKSFYKLFIKGFLVGDIEILQKIQPNSDTNLQGCTIPLAMSVISGIDLLGHIFGENKKADESENHIKEFFRITTPLFGDLYSAETINKIVNYRHGMMHNFFPKFKNLSIGICKSNSTNLFENHNGIESLNVTKFTNDFLQSIDFFEEVIESSNDVVFFDKINSAFKNLEYSNQVAYQFVPMTTMNILPQNKR